ncbi:MAG: hypothetical protein ABI333_06200 [bacterium]
MRFRAILTAALLLTLRQGAWAAPTPTPLLPNVSVHREAEQRSAPLAYGVLLNPVESGISALVNKLVLVSPIVLLGDGRGACVINPQVYALTNEAIAGAGALVGFRVFSRGRFDGLYFGVRFGGGVGSRSFKTFMGQIDAGWMWAFGKFRLGVGLNAGGGYLAHATDRGSLYLFSLDVSLGFAMGRFKGR